MKNFIRFIVVGSLILFLFAVQKGNHKNTQNNIQTNDNYNFIRVNEIMMWVSNNGDGSHDPRTDGNGFYWPMSKIGNPYPASSVGKLSSGFEDGLVIGALIDDPNSSQSLKMVGNTHRQSMQAGKVLENGLADDAGKEKYRVYKIYKNWRELDDTPEKEAFKKDYYEWPVEDGAPWVDLNGDGIYTVGVDEPEFIGDQTLWYVMNDFDSARTLQAYGSEPIGLELQVTIYAFEKVNLLKDVLFKKYKIINKSGGNLKDVYLGYWADDDQGRPDDDFVGCDTSLNLAYTYNGDNDDDFAYETPPPAMGRVLLQTPIIEGNPGDSAYYNGDWITGKKNLPMTSFAMYIGPDQVYRDPSQGVYQGSIEFYYYLQGRIWDGNEFIDPNTGIPTRTILAGDPVAGTGWYEGDGWPNGPYRGDRRYLMSVGPFKFADNDTAIIEYGFLMAVGDDNIQSVAELKTKTKAVKELYTKHFKNEFENKQIELNSYASDKSINFWWNNEIEPTSMKDINHYTGIDTIPIYKFEGYQLWQYENEYGDNPKLIKTFDLENNISRIDDYKYINGKIMDTFLFDSPNIGIAHSFNITKDYLSDSELTNEDKYYFGLTAYVYSENSIPRTYSTESKIITVTPKRNAVDYTSTTKEGELIFAEHIKGTSDGYVLAQIIDPKQITGDSYKVVFKGADDSLTYSLLNSTSGDTLIKNSPNIPTVNRDEFGEWTINENDTLGTPIFNGIKFWIRNIGYDSIRTIPNLHRVKQVWEINGPGGAKLDEPVPIWNSPNSTGTYYIKDGTLNKFIWQRPSTKEGLGYDFYEFRFTGESKYYLTGYAVSFTPALMSDTLASNTLPFEVWDIGRTPDDPSDDKRLVVKVLDKDYSDPQRCISDNKWTKKPNGEWEELFIYEADFPADQLPYLSETSIKTDHKFGDFIFDGELPEPGTVIRMTTYKPLSEEDEFEIQIPKPDFNNKGAAKLNINNISVFPNPCYVNSWLDSKQIDHLTFTNLPDEVKIRIYTLSGTFVNKIEKNDNSERLIWNLRNESNELIGSGIYLAYIDMPGIGNKILKIAVVF